MSKSHEIARNIKISTLKIINKSKSSHIGSCFSCADIISVLYANCIKSCLNNNELNKDFFIMSKGHAAAIYYCLLAELGFFNKELLNTFGENGNLFASHVTSRNIPGVEFSTGSLGHGLSVGCGLSFGLKVKNSSSHVFVLLSDGELNEGSNWEAFLFGAHHKLDNLTVIIDYNKLQSYGETNLVINLEPLSKKFEAFNWKVIEVNGHDHDSLLNALNIVSHNFPKVIIAHTVKGKGVSFMENNLKWHYSPPTFCELEASISEIECEYAKYIRK